MKIAELVEGQLYYFLGYADDGLNRPIITTYEYVGKNDNGSSEGIHLFEDVGTEDVLELTERNLDLVHDLPALAAELSRLSNQR